MQGNEAPAPEYLRQLEEEKRALTQRLTEASQENETLRERLAELDIQLNIEKAETKREIEHLATEKEDLLKENEALLGDLSSLDEKVRELSRSLEIKQLFFEDADKHLSDARERAKAWESKCQDLESRCDAMTAGMAALQKEGDERESELRRLTEGTEALQVSLGEKTAESLLLKERIAALDSERQTARAEMEEHLRSEAEKLVASTHDEGDRYRSEMAAIMSERESTIRQKDGEIETLTDEIRNLKKENEGVTLSAREIEKALVEAKEKAATLETSLSLKEAAVRELEGKVSEGAQDRQREKEELSMKLEEARKELASLGESRDSLATSLEEEREQVEILQGEMEKALAEMDGEIGNLNEKGRRLEEEKTALEAGLRQVQEELSAALGSHAEREASFREAEERRVRLEDHLLRRERSLSALEEQLKHATEEALSLKQEVLEKDRALSTAEKTLMEIHEGTVPVRETLSQRETTINELREKVALQARDIDTIKGEKDDLSVRLMEAESLGTSLSEKVAAMEEALRGESVSRAEIEKALHLKHAHLEDLKAHHGAEMERLTAKIEDLAANASRKDGEIRRLEDEVSGRRSRIAELEETLENSLRLKRHELEKYAQEVRDLKVLLSEATQNTSSLEELVRAREKEVRETKIMLKGHENFAEENKRLSGMLTEATKESDALKDMRAFLSGEIKRLEEEVKELREESEVRHRTFKHDLEGAFLKITDSTGRLEHALSEGISLAKRLDDISREYLPVTLGGTLSSPRHTGKSPKKTVVAVLIPLLILVVALGFLLRDGIHIPLKPERPDKVESTPSVTKPWAEGVKQSVSGEFVATLIFLNREAVRALGLSEKITDAGMAENHYALLEIKAENGCIPDDFLSSFEKNVTFLDRNGATATLNISEELSGEKRVVYRSNVCGNKPGAVYMKAVGSVAKNLDIQGIHILRLNKESPIILR